MTVDIFCNAMDDNVGTMIQRILDVWTQKGVIHNNHDPMSVCNGCNVSNVYQTQGRIAGTLDPNQLGIFWSDELFDVKLH